MRTKTFLAVLAAASALTPYASASEPLRDDPPNFGLLFYTDKDYKDNSVAIEDDRLNLKFAWSEQKSMWEWMEDGFSGDSTSPFNDTVSSVKVFGTSNGKTPVAALYEHKNFGGKCLTVDRNIPNLAALGFNDKVSSVRFNHRCGSPSMGNTQVILYKDKDFGGDSRWLKSGLVDLGLLGFNDAASSIKVAGVAALYWDKAYGGKCRTVRGNVSLLDGGWNDEVTGIKLHANCAGELFHNLALGKTATQSSTYGSGSGAAEASRAVDGNADGKYDHGSVSHTNDRASWWQVDLGIDISVKGVTIWNRTDRNCAGVTGGDCRLRLADFEVLTSSNEEDWVSHPHPGSAGTVTDIPLSGRARYVRIKLNSANSLQLAEVQVWQGE